MSHEISQALFERSKKVAPGGVHSPVRAFKGVGGTPRFIASSNGPEMTDVDGNVYVDYCMSFGPLIFGHRDPEIQESVTKALELGWSFGAAEPISLELAELMTGEIPFLEKVRFVNSGTEAVMSALRVARGATGRSKILKFDGCYHGHVDSMMVRAGSGLAEMANPDSAGVSESVAAETVVVPLDDLDAVRSAFEKHPGEFAAIILEPLPANNGLLPQAQEWVTGLRKICDQSGALLIFDEVISGFRTAFKGMAEHVGVEPDLVTYGKVIGGGFPVGAYGGRAKYMDLVAPMGPVYQAGTLSANPVAMSAGLAMLKKLKRNNPYQTLARENVRLSEELQAIGKETGVPIQVSRFSSLFWLIFSNQTDAIRRPDQFPAGQNDQFKKIFHGLLEKGIYLPPSAFEVGFLSTQHDRNINGRLLEALRSVLKG